MMQRCNAATLLVLAGFGALSAFAPRPVSAQTGFHVAAGVGVPLGQDAFRDAWNTGWGVEAGLSSSISGAGVGRGLDAVFSAHFNQFGLDGEGLLRAIGSEVNITLGGGTATIWGAGLALRRHFTGSPFFALIGAGYSRFSVEDVSASLGIFRDQTSFPANDAFTAQIGAGLALAAGPGFDVLIEARAVYLFDDGDDEVFLPVRMGLLWRGR